MRKNQKVVEINGKLEVKNYPRNEKPITHLKLNHLIVLFVNKTIGSILIEVIFVRIVNILIMNKSIKMIKKFHRQNHNFSITLPYANKKIREIWMNMVNTAYKSTEDMINKLQV